MKPQLPNTGSILGGLLWFVHLTTGVNITGYREWIPSQGPTLYCPDDCWTAFSPEYCCACDSYPCWDVPNINTPVVCGLTKADLYLEALNLLGNVFVVNPVKADIYELVSTHGRLIKIPGNICDFASSLVKLDLSFNSLVDISPLKCLTELDTLHLDYNLIKEVDNTTFSNMTKLRVLTMRGNNLENIPPNLIKTGDRNVLTVDFSYNFIDTVDVTNVFREGVTCVLNMSYSSTRTIVNEIGFQMNQSVMHGPGDIILEYSSIPVFPNFTEYGIDWRDMASCFSGKISVDQSTMHCDCNLYPLITVHGKEGGRFWPNIDEQEFICSSPERMKGESLTSIIKQETFYKLTCDLENCPYQGLCHCSDKPDVDRIIVNCTNAGLDEFPDEMPVGYWRNKNIDLILVGNKITEIPNRNYMDRLVELDLRRNFVTNTNPTAVKDLNCPVNVKDQRLTILVLEFSTKDPKKFEFGNHPVKCDCTNLWIGDWIRVGNALKRLRCELNDGRVMWAEDVTSDLLDCDTGIISEIVVVLSAVVLLTLIFLVPGLCYIFRYDVMIAKRKWSRQQPKRPKSFDVLISFCEDNVEAFLFLKEYVIPGLQGDDYTMFIPWFDVLSGDRDIEVSKTIEHCSNYIVVLTNDYLQDYKCVFEFDCIWKNFKSDKSTQIVIINLDFLKSKEIKDKRIEAFRRTKTDISFRDRNDTLLERLKDRLGTPRVRNESHFQRPGRVLKPKLSNGRFHGVTEVRTTSLTRQELMQHLEKEEQIRRYFSMPVHERLNLQRYKPFYKYNNIWFD